MTIPGQATGPDFILIGAMKCGTSTLAAQLAAQSGIFVTDPKEPNYFSDDSVFAKGSGWYARLFAEAEPGDILGEASTHYTKRPDYPQTLPRMQAALPAPRLVYMIRNPMQRLVSHYIHEWSQGVLSSPLAEALDSHAALVDYGLYGWQIAPYVEAYGASSILLTSLERLKREPEQELKRVTAHIGFDGPVHWRDEIKAQNVSAERVRRLPLQGLLVDNPVATFLRRTLVPKSVRNRIRASRQIAERPEFPDQARPALEARFAEDRDLLAQYFPCDPSLDLAYPFVK